MVRKQGVGPLCIQLRAIRTCPHPLPAEFQAEAGESIETTSHCAAHTSAGTTVECLLSETCYPLYELITARVLRSAQW